MDGFATTAPLRAAQHSGARVRTVQTVGAEPAEAAGAGVRPTRGLDVRVWSGLVALLLVSLGMAQVSSAQTPLPISAALANGTEPWMFGPQPMAPGVQFLPPETLYTAYLAGPHESRLGTQYFSEDDDGPLWDSTLGGRVGLFRGGSFTGTTLWQLDVEGSAILRLDPEENIDLRSVDFRAGVPFTIASGPHRFKLGYYHVSAHIGDEYLIKNPDFERLNYVRDALVFGYSRYVTERLRLYGEASWAFYHEISDPWHFQFGMEYAPTRPTGLLGEPFFAINGGLREEVDYGGTVTVHTGWAWRESRVGRLLRTGFFFQAGKSHQFEFYDESERQIGVGLWYDF